MQLNWASSGPVHVSLNSSSERRQREIFIYNRTNISLSINYVCLRAPQNLVQACTVIYRRAAMKEQVTGHKAVIPFQVNFLLLCSSPWDIRTLLKILSWATKSILSFFLPDSGLNAVSSAKASYLPFFPCCVPAAKLPEHSRELGSEWMLANP